MVDRIDYYFGPDWDIEFTDWNDIRTATDDRVLIQNFVLLASSVVRPYVGESMGAADYQRIANQLESRYEQRESVDEATITDLSLEDGELQISGIINSSEFDDTVILL